MSSCLDWTVDRKLKYAISALKPSTSLLMSMEEIITVNKKSKSSLGKAFQSKKETNNSIDPNNAKIVLGKKKSHHFANVPQNTK